MKRSLLFIFLIVLTGCAPAAVDQSKMVVVSGVPPFAAQLRDDDCGSVALASLLAHRDKEISPVIIDREVYDPVLGGTLLFDLENYAASQGFETHSGRGDTELLQNLISQDIPVLLPIELGWSRLRRPHYIVAYGFDSESFLIYKEQGKTTRISSEKLDKLWAGTGHLYLYLTDED